MKLRSVEAIVRSLDQAHVRFLVVGGLAVNAHGYHRFTKDLDLVIQLVPDNVSAAFTALSTLGYRPNVPITAEQFADDIIRESLIRTKGMEVLQFWSDTHRETPIDVFVREPFDFAEEYARSTVRELAGAGTIRIVSIPTLIVMKEAVGRPQDLDDVEHLKIRLEDR